ncbi:MAG: hemolysin III family protein [Lachnospiraceae bacterium]|nr:hemolysin III family protein [Lachnospiraceae bacterium]
MKQVRTKLEDRILPSYTKGEEIFNMVSHIVGGAFAIAALTLCVIFAALNKDAWAVVGSAIYGGTMIVLYTMSSIYHGLRRPMAKKVFQIIDHCTIYFLIAGTYTPVTLAALRPLYPVQAFVIFGIVWACCFAAATLTAIDLKKYQLLSMICYLAMGWCIIFFIRPTIRCLGTGGTVFLVTGGVAYTIGAILYGIGKKKKYVHSVFHLFVLAGSILHFFMILFYVMM